MAAIATVLCAAPLPSRSAADVDDVYALEVNPAGLAYLRSPELRLVAGGHFGESTTDLGLFVGLPLFDVLTVAVGLELDDLSAEPIRRLHLGLAAELGFLAVGAAVAEGRTGPSWKIGITARPVRWLSLAVAGLDLAQKDGRRRYDLAFGLRPFGERFTFSVRWRLLQGLGLDHDDGRPAIEGRLEAEVADGVWVAATADLRLRVGVQVSLQLPSIVTAAYGRTGVDAATMATLGAELGLHWRKEPAVLLPTKVAVLELAGELTPEPSFDILALGFDEPTYGAVPVALSIIADEPDIGGALLQIGRLEIGWGRAEEVRDEILRIRGMGKRVDCQLTGATDLAYFVASACDGITLPPPVILTVDGVAATRTFLADGLDRFGIDVDVAAMGKYKSAPDQFTRSDMSANQREALSAVLDRIYARLVEGIADGRGLPPAQVQALLGQGVQTATEALSNKLVDAVLYPDELERWLSQRHGGGIHFMAASDLARRRRPRWAGADRIAVIPIDATIAGGESETLPLGLGRSVGARSILRALETAARDTKVVAVVLRVDSPGGDATASDLIARAVARLARRKPVIASFGDVAASGGYYVAAGASTIFAEPTTITGSIGVYSLSVSAERLLGRLGVSSTVLQRGALAHRGGLLVAPGPAAMQAAAKEVAAAYRQFVRVVAEGRRMSVTEVEALAQGRVWTGHDAHAKGLVDEIGGLGDAIRHAREAAGLGADDPAELVVLPSDRTGWPDAVRRTLVGEAEVPVSRLLPPAVRPAVAAAFLAAVGGTQSRPMALMPMVLQVD